MISPRPKSNRNFILGFALLAAVSLTFGLLNFRKALPEIGIDFKVSRKEALANARTFLESRSYDLTGFRSTISFSGDFGDKLYIERELGVERVVSLAQDSLSLWGWRARFFKPLQKLEYRVNIDPKGRLVGFRREFDEAAPGATLDSTSALAIAEAFAAGPMGVDLAKWTRIETSSIDRPKRRDHSFTFEMNDFKVKDATYRFTVEVQGAESSQFRYNLREPEDWWRGWEKQRASNEMFQRIATAAMLLTVIGIFYYFFQHVKKSLIPWKTAIALGTLLAVADFIKGLNSIPLVLAWEETTSSFGSFLTTQIIGSLLNGLVLGLTLVLIFGAGEFLYRSDHPNKLSVPSLFSKRGMKSKEFFEATIMGYLLCAFDIGFIVFYYLVGQKFGFWSPADIKYDETLSTWLPWIYPLAISLYAALTEEFWFRLFGISFFKRLTKSAFLALLIPAMIWAFLHSSYPQQPGFARGIELTIVGLIAGLVMMRFGIMASLVYHYVYDAILIGLFLFRSENLYFWTSGLIVCGFLLVPAAIAGISWLRNRRFENVDDLLNGAQMGGSVAPESVPASSTMFPTASILEPVAPDSVPAHSTLSPSARKAALGIGVLGLILLFIPSPTQIGDEFVLKVDRVEAVRVASDALRNQYGVDPKDFKVGVEVPASVPFSLPGVDLGEKGPDYALSYLKRYSTPEQTEKILFEPGGRPQHRWRVTFKKPLDPTEYSALVPMNGDRLSLWREVADSLQGADLQAETARALADSVFGLQVADAANFHRIEERTTKRPNRRDWSFVYESKDPIVEQAYFRQFVVVKGDLINVRPRWIKVPEEWSRAEQKRSTIATLLSLLGLLVMIGFIIWMLRELARIMKSSEIDWKSGRIAGYIVTASILLAVFLAFPSFWSDYNTAKPLWSHISYWIGIQLFLAIFIFGFTLLVTVLAETLEQKMSPLHRPLFSRWKNIGWSWDDALVFLAIFGGALGIQNLLAWISHLLGNPVHTWELQLPIYIDKYLPVVGAFLAQAPGAIFTGATAIAALLLIKSLTTTRTKELLLLGIGIVTLCGIKLGTAGNWTTAEVLWMIAKTAVILPAGYYTLKALAIGRLHAVIFAVVAVRLIEDGVGLVGLKGSSYQIHGWIVLIPAVLGSVWLIWKGFTKAER